MFRFIYYILIFTWLFSEEKSSNFSRLVNGDNFTKINFKSEIKSQSIDQKLNFPISEIPELPNINNSILYQFNGQISIQIDDFEYEITNGTINNIPEPHIIVENFGTLRGFNFHKVKINSNFQQNEIEGKYTSINFTIHESEMVEPLLEEKNNSKKFENLANYLSINEVRNEGISYQKPAILYITGGLAGENSNFQDLLQWRKKTGYEVYHVSTEDIGGSSTIEIKNYILNAFEQLDPVPEYVCLVGDDGGDFHIDSFTEFLSGYNGEGDFPYSQLMGNDILPDVLIGRISIRTFDHLNTISQKIIMYEQAQYMDSQVIDNNWVERAALVSDPIQSGNSTIITNNYIKQTMEIGGLESIQTNYGEYNFESWMISKINEGVGFLNYRGWWGVSGFDNADVNSLINGPMLPFATMITCGTGSYATDESSLSEALLRSGTLNLPKGAIAAIGTATSGTHTAFNNIFDMGVYNGIFIENGTTTGEALAFGKLALLKTYPNNPNNWVSIFNHWNNLMGDPSVPLWTDTPKNIQINISQPIQAGSQNYDFTITDDFGDPIKDANVVVNLSNGNFIISKITDEFGTANLDITAGYGMVEITVTGKNLVPILLEYNVENEDAGLYINFENIVINDEIGNNNDIINPGEHIYIQIPCVNIDSDDASELTAELYANHSEINILNSTFTLSGIPSFTQRNFGPFLIDFSYNIFNGEQIPITLNVEDEYGNSWNSTYNLTVESYHPKVFINEDVSIINPGEFINDFSLIVLNEGNIPIEDLKLEILYNDDKIGISSDMIELGTIFPGNSVITSDIELYVSMFSQNGEYENIPIRLYNENGYDQVEYIYLQIGQIQTSDPVGPDSYGYYIIGNEDENIDIRPNYEWFEIDPYYGGPGENLLIYDDGDGNPANGSSALVNLPFTFKFYGQDYNNITVNSNGWIAFGETNLTSFRNYPIPGPGGPIAMIAPFWDDLKAENSICDVDYVYDCSGDLDCCPIEWIGDGWPDCEEQEYGCDLTCFSNDSDDCAEGHEIPVGSIKSLSLFEPYERSEFGGAVLTYYDETINRFFIEWSDMKTFYQNDEEDFQIILDPIEGEDGNIKINYKTFNNTSVGNYYSSIPIHGQYATIGIENHLQDDGLQYTFNNAWSNGAGILQSERSILITTQYSHYDPIPGDINFDDEINVVDIVLIVGIIMNTIEPTNEMLDIGDVNGDININVNDIVQIIYQIIYED